jgi:hypothetical protein
MINPTMGTVAKTVGLGVQKTRKPRGKKVQGLFSDLEKSGLKALAPLSIDNKGPGINWTAFSYNTRKSKYFDPFGFVAPLVFRIK